MQKYTLMPTICISGFMKTTVTVTATYEVANKCLWK